MQQSIITVFEETEKDFFWIALRPMLLKKISSVQNVKEAFRETSLWSVNSSHSVTAEFSGSSLLTLFSWNLQCEIWEPIGAPVVKGNILRLWLERSLLRDCFLVCDLITQISTLPFLEQFANSAILCSTKFYLGAYWRLWWRRKYPQIKTWKKPSVKLHFDVWMQLTVLHISLQCSVC